MNKELIKKLQEGECAVEFKSSDSIEKLRKLIKLAFPNDPDIPQGCVMYCNKYYKRFDNTAHWTAIYETDLPIHSVEEFFTLSFPRVMLVNTNNDIKDAVPRVVFMCKNNKYLAWAHAQTEKTAEKITDIAAWDYAWEIDEIKSIFPFTLKPEQAQSIIDIACVPWKNTLFDSWGKNIVLKDNIIIREIDYNSMYVACNSDQRALFDKIFK